MSGGLSRPHHNPLHLQLRQHPGLRLPDRDYFEPEVIDLLISVHRTTKKSPTIVGARTCEGQERKFRIAGSRFQLYRTGQLNDIQILADTK